MFRATQASRSSATWTKIGRFALVERYFGPIPGGTKATVPWVFERPLVETFPIVLNDRVELDRALPDRGRPCRHFHDDDATLLLLGDILGRGRSSRLYRKLVLEEQIAQDVSAYQSGRELAGSFGIVVTLRPSRSIAEAMRIDRRGARRRGGVDVSMSRAAARAATASCRVLVCTRAHRGVRRSCRPAERLQHLSWRPRADHVGRRAV